MALPPKGKEGREKGQQTESPVRMKGEKVE